MEERGKITPTLPRPGPTLSYWQDPPSDIADLRTTEHLPSYADYVIVGSGISGACIAWNLLQREPKAIVVLLEARQICSGATGRNGGHTKAASYRTYDAHVRANGKDDAIKVARLEQANIDATHEFAKTHGISCESRPCNTVDIMYDQDGYHIGVAAVKQMQEDIGVDDPAANYKIYDAAAAKKEFLVDGDDVKGAFEYPAGSISAYRLAIGIIKLCLDKGLNVQANTPVSRVSPHDQSDTNGANGTNGNHLPARWTAETSRGSISTPNLILATNGYSGALLAPLVGNIVPFRGQVIASTVGSKLAKLKPDGLRTTYSFIYDVGYEYMIQRPYHSTSKDTPPDAQGDFIIGGGLGLLPDNGAGEFGNTEDTIINEQNSKYLRQTLPTFFGSNWGEAEVRQEWTGIMGATKDGAPFVGQWPDSEGLWVSAGFNGHGMVLCLKCAEALVGSIFGEEYDWFPDSFKITKVRLETGTFQGRKGMRTVEENGAERKANGSLAY